ncbi:hypothetical protein D3C72_1749840 [compost metagenome]
MQPGSEVTPRLLRARVVAQRESSGALEPLDGLAAVVGCDAFSVVAPEVLDSAFGEDDVRKGLEGAVEQLRRVERRARKGLAESRHGGVEGVRGIGAQRHGCNLAHHAQAQGGRCSAMRRVDAEGTRQQRDIVDARP